MHICGDSFGDTETCGSAGGRLYLDGGQGVEQGFVVSPAVQEATIHDAILLEKGEVRIHPPIYVNCTDTILLRPLFIYDGSRYHQKQKSDIWPFSAASWADKLGIFVLLTEYRCFDCNRDDPHIYIRFPLYGPPVCICPAAKG
jgi:hypothetical protein